MNKNKGMWIGLGICIMGLLLMLVLGMVKAKGEAVDYQTLVNEPYTIEKIEESYDKVELYLKAELDVEILATLTQKAQALFQDRARVKNPKAIIYVYGSDATLYDAIEFDISDEYFSQLIVADNTSVVKYEPVSVDDVKEEDVQLQPFNLLDASYEDDETLVFKAQIFDAPTVQEKVVQMRLLEQYMREVNDVLDIRKSCILVDNYVYLSTAPNYLLQMSVISGEVIQEGPFDKEIIYDDEDQYVSLNEVVDFLAGELTVTDSVVSVELADLVVLFDQEQGITLVEGRYEPLVRVTSPTDPVVELVTYSSLVEVGADFFVPLDYVQRVFNLDFVEGEFVTAEGETYEPTFLEAGTLVLLDEDGKLVTDDEVVEEDAQEDDVESEEEDTQENPEIEESKPVVKPEVNKPVCGSNQVLVNGQCQAKPPVCGENEELVDGQCQAKPEDID